MTKEVNRFWCHEAQNIRCVREADYDALLAEQNALVLERERLGSELVETELRALKFFHRFNAATDLGREMREALELIAKIKDGEEARMIAYDALEPFRTHAALKKGENNGQ